MKSSQIKLEKIAKIQHGKSITKKNYIDNGFPAFSAKGKDGFLDHAEFEEDGIVLSAIGARCGKCFKALGKWTAINNTITIIPDKTKIDIDYLYAQLNDEKSWKKSGAAQPFISLKAARNRKVKIIPMTEQKEITSQINSSEKLIRLHNEVKEKLYKLEQSLFVAMFGNPISNNRNWKKNNLKDLTNGKYGVKAGPFGSSLKKEYYVKSGFKIYGQEQVIKENFNYGNYYINKERFEKLKSCEVKPGDILISLVGTFGKAVIVPNNVERGIINPRLVKVSFNQNKMDPYFFKIFLENIDVQQYLKSLSHGQTMGILNAGLLKKLEIIVPPINLQIKFSKCLNIIINLQNNYFAKFETFKKLAELIHYNAFRKN